MPQAHGSPSLSPDQRTVTITPAVKLAYSATYHVVVTTGVAAAAGLRYAPLAGNWLQNPGFSTLAPPDIEPPSVSATTPAPGAVSVPVSIQPQVVFSEAMLPSSIDSRAIQILDPSGKPIPQAAGSPALSSDHRTVTITPAVGLSEKAVYRILVAGASFGTTDPGNTATATPRGASAPAETPGPGQSASPSRRVVGLGVRDESGNYLAGTWVQQPGFTTISTGASTGGVAVVGVYPAAGDANIPVLTRQIRIIYDHDVRALWTALTRAQLQAMFRVTLDGAALPQSSASPSLSNGGRTVVINLVGALQYSAAYRTEAGPANQAGLAALQRAGVEPGVLAQSWATDPPWTTPSSVQGLAYEPDRGSPTALGVPADLKQTPETNTNVPVGARFVITFPEPVSRSAVTLDKFRILTSDGREVSLAPPQFRSGDTQVVLTPAGGLDPGRLYKLVVRAGRAIFAGAATAADGSQEVVVPLITEISPSAQDSTLAVAP
jgi:hypothetical protein